MEQGKRAGEMKERISELMDGELGEREAQETIALLTSDARARDAWRSYHLIGDAMREGRAVVAPRPAANAPRWRIALPAIAVAAAVALVSWVAFVPVQQQVAPAPVAVATEAPAIVPLPAAAGDYLLAHQPFSPRVALQGMSAYVRTVSETTEEARKR